MARDAFGPNLRRLRLQRGVSLEYIADVTKIPAELLAGLERNDVRQWPPGIFARAWVRQYAYAVGVDPDATVDEFCRWFPQADRRLGGVMREQAAIVGHESRWEDDVPAAGERRGVAPLPATRPSQDRPSRFGLGLVVRLRRVLHRV
jgi:transcriptional regulator with XRE-family HTH domain